MKLKVPAAVCRLTASAATLDHFGVADPERAEVLGFFTSLEPEIVAR